MPIAFALASGATIAGILARAKERQRQRQSKSDGTSEGAKSPRDDANKGKDTAGTNSKGHNK